MTSKLPGGRVLVDPVSAGLEERVRFEFGRQGHGVGFGLGLLTGERQQPEQGEVESGMAHDREGTAAAPERLLPTLL